MGSIGLRSICRIDLRFWPYNVSIRYWYCSNLLAQANFLQFFLQAILRSFYSLSFSVVPRRPFVRLENPL